MRTDLSFVESLYDLGKRDARILREMARGAASGDLTAARDFVASFAPTESSPIWGDSEEPYAMVAGLFALHPKAGAVRLPMALRTVLVSGDEIIAPDTYAGTRFKHLMMSDSRSLLPHLAWTVRMVASKGGPGVDYADLLMAVLHWDPREPTVRHWAWAYAFWTGRTPKYAVGDLDILRRDAIDDDDDDDDGDDDDLDDLDDDDDEADLDDEDGDGDDALRYRSDVDMDGQIPAESTSTCVTPRGDTRTYCSHNGARLYPLVERFEEFPVSRSVTGVVHADPNEPVIEIGHWKALRRHQGEDAGVRIEAHSRVKLFPSVAPTDGDDAGELRRISLHKEVVWSDVQPSDEMLQAALGRAAAAIRAAQEPRPARKSPARKGA